LDDSAGRPTEPLLVAVFSANTPIATRL
jgi:hypothetical protein